MLHSNLKNLHHNRQNECKTNILVLSSTPRAYKVPGTEDGQREAEAVSSSSSGLFTAR